MLDLFSLFDSTHDQEDTTTYLGKLVPGSIEAKKAWLQIEQQALSPESIQKAIKAGYPDAHGWYKGGILQKGAGHGHTDFNFLVDKLHYYNGYSLEVASKIAGKVATGIR